MSDAKVEGTLVVDGLLEGRVPRLPDSEARLRQWVEFVGRLGLRFSLEVDGASFSLLADNTPVRVGAPGRVPSALLADALRELLKVFPPDERRGLLSTLRSVEYRRGLEVQTLYLVTPEGRIEVREESAPTDTKAPPRPLSRRERIRLAALGIGGALLLFAVSAVFVDYRALWRSLVEAATPFDPQTLEVDATAFKGYVAVEDKKVASGRKAVLITLRRTRAFPRTAAALQKAYEKAGGSLAARLAVEALARGYVRCEFFDDEGGLLGFSTQRIRALQEREAVEVVAPLSSEHRLARVVITY